MWITKVSPTAAAGSPVEDCNMPELSIATWPFGSARIAKIVDGSAAITRSTCMRSLVIAASCHRSRVMAAGAGAGRRPEDRSRHRDLVVEAKPASGASGVRHGDALDEDDAV